MFFANSISDSLYFVRSKLKYCGLLFFLMQKQVMRNFTYEAEESLCAFLFTNPHGKVSFVYPQELVAGEELSPLMSAISRTHVSTQDRVLQFLDREKTEQTRRMLGHVRELVDIFRHPDGTLKISRKTGDFTKEWVLAHGHGSVKEGTFLFGHVEDLSDITGKKITGHPLAHPQVKSTRYIPYAKVLPLALEDPDLLALPEAEKYLEHVDVLNQTYVDITDRLRDRVFTHPDTAKVVAFLKTPTQVAAEVERKVRRARMLNELFVDSPEERTRFGEEILASLDDEIVQRDIRRFVLDYSRVYLPAVTKTSVVYALDARTLEEVITDLLSGQRLEDQQLGQALWDEAKKLAPVLLGEKSHVRIDAWKVKNETELRAYIQERLGSFLGVNRGKGAVNLLSPKNMEMYTDRFNAALVVFPYVDSALQDIMAVLTDQDVKEILVKAHEYRQEYDVLHPAISHGGLMVELVMGYHAYRDMFRHRRGSRSVQLLTTRLGFETPDIFSVFGLTHEYVRLMERCALLYEEARAINPHVAEKLVPFGANCRALHSWQPNQIGYVGRLRGDIAKGNVSYVRVTREMIAAAAELMPETAKHFRCDTKEYPAHLWKRGYEWFDATQRA